MQKNIPEKYLPDSPDKNISTFTRQHLEARPIHHISRDFASPELINLLWGKLRTKVGRNFQV